MVVASELKEADTVVTEGLTRLRAGDVVRVAGLPAKFEAAGK